MDGLTIVQRLGPERYGKVARAALETKVGKLLEHRAYSVVEFGHSRAIKTLFSDHCLVFRGQMCPNMYACGVMPDKKGLSGFD